MRYSIVKGYLKMNCVGIIMYIMWYLTGPSIHAPIQMNIPYRKMIRIYIYNVNGDTNFLDINLCLVVDRRS